MSSSDQTRQIPAGATAPAAATVAPPQRQAIKKAASGSARAASPAARAAAGAPRRVRLVVSRIDPWSAMKIAFLLSVALGIATVIALAVLWSVLNGMGVFDQINDIIAQVRGNSTFNILDYVGLSRVISLGTVLAVVNVALLTALGTLGALLYNISAALVGGLTTTLTDD